MLAKAAIIFIIFMMVLGMVGKLRLPKIARDKPKKCTKCGGFLIGKTPCTCTKH